VIRRALFTIVAMAAPKTVLACPVCFGQSDAPMAVATNMGIWVMLGVVAVVLAAFASFFVHLARRARLAGEVTEAREVRPAHAGHYLQGREGIV
jgi:hypothetical protein